MTVDQVEAILGDRPPFRAGKDGDWTYTWHLWSDWSRTIDVHFMNGVVDRKSNSMHWDRPAGKTVSGADTKPVPVGKSEATRHVAPDALLSRENYNRITSGMSADQVDAILGKPLSTVGTKADWTGTWQLSGDKSKTIKIHFKNGLVDQKSNTMRWLQESETTHRN